jgi:hypothetical protein
VKYWEENLVPRDSPSLNDMEVEGKYPADDIAFSILAMQHYFNKRKIIAMSGSDSDSTWRKGT